MIVINVIERMVFIAVKFICLLQSTAMVVVVVLKVIVMDEVAAKVLVIVGMKIMVVGCG